ncbi:MAG TPA: anthranilate phosphoribosyltransferase [Acidobacteriota bacterium]|nr:anthranilate phosphoribosyltransferase [Acidobacteriota bacterium]
MLKSFIRTALDGGSLHHEAAHEAMSIVMNGQATPSQVAAWLVALRMKGETIDEIVGFARAMRGAMRPLTDVPADAIDTCGTGGDELCTFNISTAAALVVAACSVPVAKHGNRAVSSQSGSADVLAALDFEIDPGPEVVSRALTETRFAFMFAPRFHPAMKHALAPRREIGVRTVFNILGPLCNPAGVKRQIVGVYDRAWMTPLAEVLGALGAERAMVVAGADGADELLPTGVNHVAEWDGTDVRTYTISAADAGLTECALDDLSGGEAAANADVIRRIAAGDTGPKTDTVLLNAAAALLVAGCVESLAAGVARAREAIATGDMADLLSRAVAATRMPTRPENRE